MVVTGKLYGPAKSFRTSKVLIAARLGGSSLTHVEDTPPRDKFPLGLSPAFDGNGVLLFGAESIALHVGGPAMLAGQKIEEIVQWLQWSEAQLLPNVLAYVLPCVSIAQLDKKSVDENRLELQAQLSHLNSLLLSRTFLVGERLSLADISVALDLLPAFQHVLDASARATIGNVTRWLLTVLNQPHVKAVVGDVHFAEHVAQFDAKTFKDVTAKLSKDVHVAEPKDHKPDHAKGKAGKEHATSTKKDHAKEEEDDEADDAHRQEPKAVDPYAAMPKGYFA